MKALLLVLGIVVSIVICIVYSMGDSPRSPESNGMDVQDSVLHRKLKSHLHGNQSRIGMSHT